MPGLDGGNHGRNGFDAVIRSLLGAERQTDDEFTAAAGALAVGVHRAAMQRDELAHEREANAESTLGRVRLIEHLEDARHGVLGDADARVLQSVVDVGRASIIVMLGPMSLKFSAALAVVLECISMPGP